MPLQPLLWFFNRTHWRTGRCGRRGPLRNGLGGRLPEARLIPPTSSTSSPRPSSRVLMAMGSGRFFGSAIGGILPTPLAADWLVSAWDQNSRNRYATSGTVVTEEAAAAWLLELLGPV